MSSVSSPSRLPDGAWVGALVLFLAGACDRERAPAPVSPPVTAALNVPAAGETPKPPRVVADAGPDTATTLAALCAVPGNKVFFEADSSKLTRKARELLKRIATCLTGGPARGEELLVVGHSYPGRGTRSHDLRLAKNRARAVATFLREQGIASSAVDTAAIREDRPWSGGRERSTERGVTILLAQ